MSNELVTVSKSALKESFEKFHNERYNPKSEHYRFEHFYKELSERGQGKDPIGYVYVDENKMPVKFAYNPAALGVYMSIGCKVNTPDIDGGYITEMFVGEPPVSADERAQIKAELLEELSEEFCSLGQESIAGARETRRGLNFASGYVKGLAAKMRRPKE